VGGQAFRPISAGSMRPGRLPACPSAASPIPAPG